MAEIIVVNTLEVETDIGKCQIQLCVGDITSLPKEDEVDVLVLSAFPGKSVISNRQTGCSLAYYNAIFQHNIALFADKLVFQIFPCQSVTLKSFSLNNYLNFS